MWFYQPIPTIPALYLIRTSDSCAVQASDSQWQLTDSSSFTNFRRADTATVRVNGAEASQPTTQQVSVSDSLTGGLTDTFTGSQSLSVTDTVSIGQTDTASIASLLSASETITVQAQDAATVLNAFATAGSLTAGLTDFATQLAAVLAATDSIAVQAEDAAQPVSVSAVASDSLMAGLTDTFTGSQAFPIQDSASVQASETLANSSSVSTADPLAILLSDVGSLSQVTILASDSLSTVLSEVVNVVQNALLSVSDNLVTGFSESATLTNALSVYDSLLVSINDSFTGSQALGVSDDFGFLLSEDQSSSLLVAALDGVATSLSGAASVYLSQDLLDNCTVQLGDVGSKQDVEAAIPKSAGDSCGVSVEEGAVTELAGPYWAGTLGEDRGLVYADSYVMGRRENPGRMRW